MLDHLIDLLAEGLSLGSQLYLRLGIGRQFTWPPVSLLWHRRHCGCSLCVLCDCRGLVNARATAFGAVDRPARLVFCCSATRYTSEVVGELWWDDEDVEHIRTRSDRYPDADNVEPAWTLEATDDPHRVVRDPDPKSRSGYVRIIGMSLSAGFVLTVIVDPEDWSGVTAWKTRGADLREYLDGKEQR